ncbi:MAG: hypothetical protein ACFFD2_05475 [Promethearchaeota archaeon]
MSKLNISLIFYPNHQTNHKEVLDIKNALEYFDNNVKLFTVNRDLISQIRNNHTDLIFNLVRRHNNTKYNVSIAALCELLGLNMIGPNVFTSCIINSKEILVKVLKYDNIPLLDSLIPPKYSDIIDVFLLENQNSIILQKFPLNFKFESNLKLKITEICKKSYQSIHGSDFCHLSFFLKQKAEPLLYKINPQPSLGNDGDFAQQAKLDGINYNILINLIVLNALHKYTLPISKKYIELENLLHGKFLPIQYH